MKELNLVEILKDVPEGTELYSTIFGNVKLFNVDENEKYPIQFLVLSDGETEYIKDVACDGRWVIDYLGECTLFPSKENRDWSIYKYDPTPIGTPVMCFNRFKNWILKYYAGDGEVFMYGTTKGLSGHFKFIIPISEFDFANPNHKENLKKSIV